MAADNAIQSRSGRTRRRGRRDAKPSSSGNNGIPAANFILYVEGPRDRDLLRIWARRLSHDLARALDGCVVIMGGRQPARAADHFRRLLRSEPEATGLVVLDRDHHDEPDGWPEDTRLGLYTWPRRHIESYVLVPAAIRRAAGCAPDDLRVDRVLEEHMPPGKEARALQNLDAKRLLAARGPLAQMLGCSLATADIARCMLADEVHGDVIDLLGRARSALGLTRVEPEIVVRARNR